MAEIRPRLCTGGGGSNGVEQVPRQQKQMSHVLIKVFPLSPHERHIKLSFFPISSNAAAFMHQAPNERVDFVEWGPSLDPRRAQIKQQQIALSH